MTRHHRDHHSFCRVDSFVWEYCRMRVQYRTSVQRSTELRRSSVRCTFPVRFRKCYFSIGSQLQYSSFKYNSGRWGTYLFESAECSSSFLHPLLLISFVILSRSHLQRVSNTTGLCVLFDDVHYQTMTPVPSSVVHVVNWKRTNLIRTTVQYLLLVLVDVSTSMVQYS